MDTNNRSAFQFDSAIESDQLTELYQNDLDHVLLMFELYLDTIDGEFRQLELAARENKRELLRQAAHKIKPVFLMVGLKQLNVIAQQIETQYQSLTAGELIASIRVLESKISSSSLILKKEISRIKSFKTKQ